MRSGSSPLWFRQQGAVALGSALLMLVLIAAIGFAASQIAIGEQRSMGNEVRAQAAAALAEIATERGAAYLRRNAALIASVSAGGWMQPGALRWTTCTTSNVQLPCGDGQRNLRDSSWTAYANVFAITTSSGTARVHYLARAAVGGAAMPLPGAIAIVGEGVTDDASGRAVVQLHARIFPLIVHFPSAPLMAGGELEIAGDASVVPNVDANAITLSVWSGDNVTLGEDARSCKASVFAALNACPRAGPNTLSNANTEGADVLDVDDNQGNNADSANFPRDLSEQVFGIDAAHWPLLRSQAQALADCSTLGIGAQGFYWIDHDCAIAAGAVVGNGAAPVLLVVAGGKFTMAAGSVLNGLVVLLSQDAGESNVDMGTGSTLQGALIADHDLHMDGGPFAVYYRADIAARLTVGDAAPTSLALVPGSWRDY